MILTARDEGGNEGQSAAFEFRLPERPFSKPMARALVEQRRILALDADAQASVLTALTGRGTVFPDTVRRSSPSRSVTFAGTAVVIFWCAAASSATRS
jgi:Domain of unknown function (DUF4175)